MIELVSCILVSKEEGKRSKSNVNSFYVTIKKKKERKINGQIVIARNEQSKRNPNLRKTESINECERRVTSSLKILKFNRRAYQKSILKANCLSIGRWARRKAGEKRRYWGKSKAWKRETNILRAMDDWTDFEHP